MFAKTPQSVLRTASSPFRGAFTSSFPLLWRTCGHGSPCPYKRIENIMKNFHKRTPPPPNGGPPRTERSPLPFGHLPTPWGVTPFRGGLYSSSFCCPPVSAKGNPVENIPPECFQNHVTASGTQGGAVLFAPPSKSYRFSHPPSPCARSMAQGISPSADGDLEGTCPLRTPRQLRSAGAA